MELYNLLAALGWLFMGVLHLYQLVFYSKRHWIIRWLNLIYVGISVYYFVNHLNRFYGR